MGGGQNPVSETRQTTNWSDITQGGSGLDTEYSAYTGTWIISGAPTGSVKPYWNIDGVNGALYVQIIEGNVGTATVNIEGSYDGTHWFPIGYYPVVTAGASQATLTRTVAAIAVAQNQSYVVQLLDAYPLVRARPSANTGSLTAGLYLLPA